MEAAIAATEAGTKPKPRAWSVIALLVLGLTAGPDTAFAQEECDRVTPVDGADGYKDRNGLCEGLYRSPNDARLELVSLTFGAPEVTERALVEVEAPSIDGQPTIQITALPIQASIYYRMDANIEAGQILIWTTSELLDYLFGRGELQPTDIGVFGLIESASPVTVAVPLSVRSSPQEQLPWSEPIELAVRSTVPLESIFFREYNCDEVAPDWTNLSDRLRRDSLRISLTITDLPEVCVDVKGKAAGEDFWPALELTVLLPQ